MRLRILAIIILLLLQLPVHAQDNGYPTLAALANLEIPTFDFAEMVGRMSSINPVYLPPGSPPDYQLGDREEFAVPVGPEIGDSPATLELRAMTDQVLIWVQESVTYPRWRAQALAALVEQDIIAPMGDLFQYSAPPGVDGDPRLIIAMIRNPEYGPIAFFSRGHTRPSRLSSGSNQREMVVVNLALDEKYDFFDRVLVEILAHEYQHILHFHRDFGEELWLNEAFSSYAAYVASASGMGPANTLRQANRFLGAPRTPLTHWRLVDDVVAKYGAGSLFMLYLAERFGTDVIRRLHAESANGWSSVDKVLREDFGLSADEAFADWVVANYIQDATSGYGYGLIDSVLDLPQLAASLNSFPAVHESSLHQYSSDYIVVDARGADKLSLRLTQSEDARLIPVSPIEGDHYYYAVTTDGGNSTLTRTLSLVAFPPVHLEYRIWHDLYEYIEYAYVSVSVDGGESWETLPGNFTEESNVYSDFYTDGYTGGTVGWRGERMDLSQYAPGRIMLRFEIMSDYVTNYKGIAIDDLRIAAFGYEDGFEVPDDAWIADGWIRTDNRLPNSTWLQVIQETTNGLDLTRTLMTGPGEMTVDLLPGADRAVIAISPVVPLTALKTKYALEVNLLDAEGNALVVTRNCSLTTTHALNFRNSPNGSKIGLLPKGATVDALDRQDGWFQVEYNGVHGWIHGDYVTQTGNCP